MDFKELYRLYGHVLTEREKDVMEMRCNVGMTLEEIGCMIGETRLRVRAIENKALRKLMAMYNA